LSGLLVQQWRQWEAAGGADRNLALQRESVIGPLAAQTRLGMECVEQAALQLGLGRSVLYDLLQRYRQRPQLPLYFLASADARPRRRFSAKIANIYSTHAFTSFICDWSALHWLLWSWRFGGGLLSRVYRLLTTARYGGGSKRSTCGWQLRSVRAPRTLASNSDQSRSHRYGPNGRWRYRKSITPGRRHCGRSTEATSHREALADSRHRHQNTHAGRLPCLTLGALDDLSFTSFVPHSDTSPSLVPHQLHSSSNRSTVTPHNTKR
jgi:hypothetical protein